MTGSLLLSLSCGVLLEELVFGLLCRLLLAPRPGDRQKPGSDRKH
jgi:hypothetical protein